MSARLNRPLAIAASVVLAWGIVYALDVPPLRGRVNDLAGLLSQDLAARLENQLSGFEQQSGHQVVLLTIQSLQDEDLASFALKTAEHWKLGQKGGFRPATNDAAELDSPDLRGARTVAERLEGDLHLERPAAIECRRPSVFLARLPLSAGCDVPGLLHQRFVRGAVYGCQAVQDVR